MSHRHLGVLVLVLASAPITLIAGLVFYGWTAATLHREMRRR